MSQNVSTAVMQRRVEPHDSLDDFPTPPWATRALIEYVIKPRLNNYAPLASETLDKMTVREPCCNRGFMAKPLAESFRRVIATDIFDYGWEGQQETIDYLYPVQLPAAEWSIFNSPFALAEQFIMRSFETPCWVGTASLVRQAFQEGTGRYRRIYSPNRRPPTIIAQFSERVIMTKGKVRDPAIRYWDATAKRGKGAWRKPSTATAYCWMVWMDGIARQPTMWIPPCRTALERPGDYPPLSEEEANGPSF